MELQTCARQYMSEASVQLIGKPKPDVTLSDARC